MLFAIKAPPANDRIPTTAHSAAPQKISMARTVIPAGRFTAIPPAKYRTSANLMHKREQATQRDARSSRLRSTSMTKEQKRAHDRADQTGRLRIRHAEKRSWIQT